MKNILLLFLGLSSFMSWAQDENIFLGMDYWKTNPTLSDVKQAIKEGNSPTEMTIHNFDATGYAILGNASVDIIDYLTNIEGNEVTKQTHDGRTYMMWAAYRGNYPAVEMLLKKGSDMKETDDKGYDMVTFAAVGGNTDPKLYQLFVDNGLALTSTTRKGQNALLLTASKAKSLADLQFFIDNGLALDSTDDDGNNVFLYAAQGGNMNVMKELVAKGFDTKKVNKKGENAMFFAARGQRRNPNKLEVFEYLADNGVAVSTVSKENNTPLHTLAFSSKYDDVFDFFVKHGVNINTVNDEGNTALMNAMRFTNKSAIDYLFDKTNNLHQVNREHQSALTYAVRRQNEDATDKLLAHSLDAKIVDNDGKNLLTHLFNSTRKDMTYLEKYLPIFTEMGVEAQPEIMHIAVEKHNADMVKKAKELGVSIDAKDENGNTPLQVEAMRAKNIDFLQVLLAEGANKKINTEFGESVYDLASENELLSAQAITFLK